MNQKKKSENIFLEKINEIGLKVHTKYIERLYQNVTETELNSIFEHIESYWFDRDRSAMIWLCNEIVGGTPEKTIIPSLIMSLTSSGIGIHDDIIDKTMIKHHNWTASGKFGVEKAIVAGDLLIIKGLTSLGTMYKEFDMATAHLLNDVFIDYFSEMAVGEIWEINSNKNLDQDLDIYHRMLWKLGADGEACARLGAVSGNATDEQREALAFFGRSLGYILRLKDEIMDILNIGGNLENRIEKESIPLGLLYISKQSLSHHEEVSDILKKGTKTEDIKKIINMCYETQIFKYINEEIEKTYNKAIKALNIFPDSDTKFLLVKILDIKKDQSSLIY